MQAPRVQILVKAQQGERIGSSYILLGESWPSPFADQRLQGWRILEPSEVIDIHIARENPGAPAKEDWSRHDDAGIFPFSRKSRQKTGKFLVCPSRASLTAWLRSISSPTHARTNT